MGRWEETRRRLAAERHTWLVTGAAGFIGSHLVEGLLGLGQIVRGLDNFATGSRENLDSVHKRAGDEAWERFAFLEGDIREPGACREACHEARFVLHQAALGSVPRSLADPLTSHAVNVDGFLNVLLAAKDARCARFVYASSSSVYGDSPELPKREERIGAPLSPYAATKRIDEIYAETIMRAYGLEVIGLRYFNVFGPRQDPDGPYAAVIPRWIATLLEGGAPHIHGDGATSRDFCPVNDAVQANFLAALAPKESAGRAYNVALGRQTTLTELFDALRAGLAELGIDRTDIEAHYTDFRPGDVRHSLAALDAAATDLGYEPDVDFAAGLKETLTWFVEEASGAVGEDAPTSKGQNAR